jgi:REP element-mobilizing transposase RayT
MEPLPLWLRLLPENLRAALWLAILTATASSISPWRMRAAKGHLLADHVHIMISIPPKYAVAQVIGFIKGKSAIHLARVYGDRKQNYVGQNFWARGYFVSTVGRDEAVIREPRSQA